MPGNAPSALQPQAGLYDAAGVLQREIPCEVSEGGAGFTYIHPLVPDDAPANWSVGIFYGGAFALIPVYRWRTSKKELM